jgi:type VI protein secretion system component VasF
LSREESKSWRRRLLDRVRKKAGREAVDRFRRAEAEKLQARTDGRREHFVKVLIAAGVGALLAAVGWIVKTFKGLVFLE